MTEMKICTRCDEPKDPMTDFYLCAGKWRSECKKCTIQRNVLYQQKNKTWKYRYVDDDARREYMRDYYSKNLGKFARYRDEFRERYPEYYKEYFRMRKEKK